MILDTTCRRTLPRRALLLAAITGTAVLVPLAMLRPAVKAQTLSLTPLSAQQGEIPLHLSDAQEQFRLAQARQLREHLAAWTQDNKAALLHMQQARPDDLAALMRVYASLMKQPLPLWGTDPRVAKGNGMPGFSVQTTELTLPHLQRSKEPICQGIRQDFATYRDIRLSRSIDPGSVCIVVWASGRITKSTVSERFLGHGKPFLQTESQKALVPGFFPLASDKKIGERIRYSIAE